MPLILLHIVCGSLAIAAGFAAFAFSKGGRWHRLAGQVFAGSMLVMAGTGLMVALGNGQRLNQLAACFTLYLVLTGWQMARRDLAGRLGLIGLGMAAAFAIAAAGYGLAWRAISSGEGSMLAPPAIIFASIALAMAVQDARVLRRGGPAATLRIRRHLWRMGLALTIATASFFLGQQDEMPQWMLGPHLLIPPLGALGLGAWWLRRMRDGTRVQTSRVSA